VDGCPCRVMRKFCLLIGSFCPAVMSSSSSYSPLFALPGPPQEAAPRREKAPREPSSKHGIRIDGIVVSMHVVTVTGSKSFFSCGGILRPHPLYPI
jgi:hypothetical protein